MKTPTSICQFIYDRVSVDYEMNSSLEGNVIKMLVRVPYDNDVTISVEIESDDTAETVTAKLDQQYERIKSLVAMAINDWEDPMETQGYIGDRLTL